MLENLFGKRKPIRQEPANILQPEEVDNDTIMQTLEQMKRDELRLYEIKRVSNTTFQIIFLDTNGSHRNLPFELSHTELALVIGIFGRPIINNKLY